MRSHSFLRLALMAASALYIVASFMLMSKVLSQGAWKGVEDLSFMMGYSGTEKLQVAGSITAVAGLLLTVFGLILKSGSIERPFRAVLIAAAVLGPIGYLVQSKAPDYLAQRLAAAAPEQARLAVDTYYWQRLLALPGVVDIEGFPDMTGKMNVAPEVNVFRASLFFNVDIRQLNFSPRYTSEQLPYAYLFHYRYQGELAPGETYLNTSRERRQRIENALSTYITPADDIRRIEQMIFIPYTLLVCMIFLMINTFMLLASLFTLATNRPVRWWAVAAFVAALAVMPLALKDPLSEADGYKRMAASGEFLVPEPVRLWALRYETLVMSVYAAVENYVNGYESSR